MKVTNEKWIVMAFDDGREPIRAKQIGRGRWTTAYHDAGRGHVYLFTKVAQDGGTDYAKEMLATLPAGVRGNRHLPRLERFDDVDGAGRDAFYVFRSPFYLPLTAKCGVAWKQFKRLRAVAEEEHSELLNRTRGEHYGELPRHGYDFMTAVIEHMRVTPEATPELIAALEGLCNASLNYGSTWWFEFAKRNCAVDAGGALVLLDCIFDREQVMSGDNVRRQRHEQVRRFA